MSKRNRVSRMARNGGTAPVAIAQTGAARADAFTFGDPEGVLDRRDLIMAIECWQNGQWYEPPVRPADLARAYRVSPHHTSAIQYKRNQLVRHFRPSRWLDRRNFAAFALDFLVMGNGYLERRDNLAGRPLQMLHSPAMYTRRGVDPGVYWWVPGYKQEAAFRPDRVVHVWEQDLAQELYGLPEYLGALNSGFLNEEATIFRRRFYRNGSHAGFIFYNSEANMSSADSDAIRKAMRESKGPGNFRNLYVHVPNGKKDGIQIIPISEIAAKDEFLGIKGTTRDDILASHRVPPQLLGVMAANATGFGDVRTATDAFHYAEIEPLQLRMLEVNDQVGLEVIAFDPYQPMAPQAAAA